MAQLRADFWAVCDPGWARWGQNRGEGDEVRGEDITPALLYSLPTHTINIGRVSLDCATTYLLKHRIYPNVLMQYHSNIDLMFLQY